MLYPFRDVQGLSVAPVWYTGYDPPYLTSHGLGQILCSGLGFEPTPSEPIVAQNKHS